MRDCDSPREYCPKTGEPVVSARSRRGRFFLIWLAPLTGLVALIWFVVRVVPKPSRAAYPCQRIALPVASGFVLWIVGMITSAVALGKAKHLFARSRVALAAVCLLVSVTAGLVALSNMPETPAQAAPPVPNDPMGVAKGIHPGRVVWVRDPNANDWDGVTGEYIFPENTDQAAVDAMVSRAIRTVAGEPTDAAAWDAIFHHFNQTHGRGDVGYTPGEKISIKVNMVGCGAAAWIDMGTYDQVNSLWKVNTSPNLMLALGRQLVNQAGVPQEDISIGDTLTYFVNHMWDPLHDEFPNMVYVDSTGLHERTRAQPSANVIDWSSPLYNPGSFNESRIPQTYAAATYHINLAHLKGHEGGGVTLCGKNYYGSFIHRPDAGGYFNQMHPSLPYQTAGYGRYRALVDLVAHKDTGGKGLLYMIDGLWSGSDAGSRVLKWNMLPFDGDWPSSLFVSQDPVAIDSVGYDFLYAESLVNTGQPYPTSVNGGDDYLRQLASSQHWPFGITYDPEGDGTPIESMGAHEHWNNSTDRQYSRNLGTGNGIELLGLTVGPPGDVNCDGSVNLFDLLQFASAWNTCVGDANYNAAADLDDSGCVNIFDLLIMAAHWDETI